MTRGPSSDAALVAPGSLWVSKLHNCLTHVLSEPKRRWPCKLRHRPTKRLMGQLGPHPFWTVCKLPRGAEVQINGVVLTLTDILRHTLRHTHTLSGPWDEQQGETLVHVVKACDLEQLTAAPLYLQPYR